VAAKFVAAIDHGTSSPVRSARSADARRMAVHETMGSFTPECGSADARLVARLA